MTDAVPRGLWSRVASWFAEDSQHVTLRFIPDEAGEPVEANGGYLRIVLAEGFLAQATSWGTKRFPALHGGVSLSYLGGPSSPLTTFCRAPGEWTVAGAHLDYPMTPLLPFNGGIVEISAALYVAAVEGPLATAVDLIGSLATLVGPPLSVAAQVAGKVSEGLDKVVAAQDAKPVLGLHTSMVSPGSGGTVLRPGHLVVLRNEGRQLTGTPVIVDGRLHLDMGGRIELPTGVDYLVVRVDCRRDRDDWRLPELDALIRSAGEALIYGRHDAYVERRTEAIARAWNTPDLIPIDRRRIADLVKQELDSLEGLGAVPADDRTIEVAATERLRALDDPELDAMTLHAMLS